MRFEFIDNASREDLFFWLGEGFERAQKKGGDPEEHLQEVLLEKYLSSVEEV